MVRMNKKKNIRILKYIMALALTLSIFTPFVQVKAQTLNDMYNELSTLKKKKAELDSQKRLTENEINELNNNIAETSEQIEQARTEVIKAEEDIEKSNEQIKQKQEESKELLKFLQLSTGENVYLDYILASEDYTDFVYRYSVVTQLTAYNTELVTDLENLIKELEQKKVDLALKQKQLDTKRNELNSKKSILNGQLAEVKEGYVDINEEIDALNKSIRYYENLGCAANQDVIACATMPYADGFRYPLKSGRISSGWGKRTFILNGKWVTDFHYGYDFAGNPEGTPVYPIAAGKVARIIYRSSCGGNQVFIFHTVNGKNYTSKYVHLLKINVELGDIVSDTTVIGAVGGKTTATSYGGYDRCTTGAHLHFGIADGHRTTYVDSYTFNPIGIFPKLLGQGSTFYSR